MDPTTRRTALARTLVAFAAASRNLSGAESKVLKADLDDLEKQSGGRLGCAVLNTATGAITSHRGDERFPMCSTFKAAAVALVLRRVDRGTEHLDRRIVVSERDILSYAPVTKLHVGGDGMSVADLCAAAITVSDNTAANLLLASFAGPTALTRFLREVGDPVTRLDRNEPDLNEATPGDPRDTTSPIAMLHTLRKFALGTALKPASRELFAGWLIANTTGDKRIRAGLPKTWTVGDKTGSGAHETGNDIAVIWPAGRKPFVVTAYLTQGPSSDDARGAVLAGVGRAVADEINRVSPVTTERR
jgi:beta-lactamase class A